MIQVSCGAGCVQLDNDGSVQEFLEARTRDWSNKNSAHCVCHGVIQVAIFCFLFCGASSSLLSRSRRQTTPKAFAVLWPMDDAMAHGWHSEELERLSTITCSEFRILNCSQPMFLVRACSVKQHSQPLHLCFSSEAFCPGEGM